MPLIWGTKLQFQFGNGQTGKRERITIIKIVAVFYEEFFTRRRMRQLFTRRFLRGDLIMGV